MRRAGLCLPGSRSARRASPVACVLAVGVLLALASAPVEAAAPGPGPTTSRLDRLCAALEPSAGGGKLLFLLVENFLRVRLAAWPRDTRVVPAPVRAEDEAFWEQGRAAEHGLLEALDAEGRVLHRVVFTSARVDDGLLRRLQRRVRVEARDLQAGVDKLLAAVQSGDSSHVATVRYVHTHPTVLLGSSSEFSGADRRQATLLRDYLARAGLPGARLEMVLLFAGRRGRPGKDVRLVPPSAIPWGSPHPLGPSAPPAPR